MAVIETFRAKNGALIEIDDTYTVDVPEEEMKLRKQRVVDVAREIAVNNELRRLAAERDAKSEH